MPALIRSRGSRALLAALVWIFAQAAAPAVAAAQEVIPQQAQEEQAKAAPTHALHPLHEIDDAMLRLPLAAVLGTALALRPKRKGTPKRSPAVIQTQIMLAVVGSVIMLVVGASLARAFGIVGAANLIRYRSKIDDPKDAVVMLCALAVGLASGVGLYALAGFSTFFMGAALWVIESFEPQTRKHFTLKVKAEKDTDAIKPKIEQILARYRGEFELRTSSDDEVCYDVQVPLEVPTDRISDAILRLDPEGHLAVDWAEKSDKKK